MLGAAYVARTKFSIRIGYRFHCTRTALMLAKYYYCIIAESSISTELTHDMKIGLIYIITWLIHYIC